MEHGCIVVLILMGVSYAAPSGHDDVQSYDYEKQPQSHEFGHRINDKYGNSGTRKETGTRDGFYSYKDDLDVYQQAKQSADDGRFPVFIVINEPRVTSQKSDDVNVKTKENLVRAQETSDFHSHRLHIAHFPQVTVKPYVPQPKSLTLGNHHKPLIMKDKLVQIRVSKNSSSAFLFPKFRTAFKTAPYLVLIPMTSIGSHKEALSSVPSQKGRSEDVIRSIPVLVIKKLKNVSKLLPSETFNIIKGHNLRVQKVKIDSSLTDLYKVNSKVPKQNYLDIPVYKDK
ncbi:uncharacterized protein LOC143227406 [Tachypleus tridentatus]|uniref:uncharacterized protein LOC143227406 n=1 Tax=Tachypleus tridentatus TaxID=6853 RepID=UPI003FD34EF4